MNNSVLINTQIEQKRSVNNLLQFFQDDRGKNLLRSFAALSQNYVDLRACCIHGTVKQQSTTHNSSNNNTLSSAANQQKQENTNASYSIVHDPANEKYQTVQNKIKSIRDSVDTIKSASNSLLNEMLNLMNRVKEMSHATFVAAFNFVEAKKQNNNEMVDVNLRLLKDVLEILVNGQLQNKIVTIHVIFNEVSSAIKSGLGSANGNAMIQDDDDRLPEIKWKLTLDQLRVYQAALTAEFSSLASSGAGVGSGNHPLESIISMLDRIGVLCAKMAQ